MLTRILNARSLKHCWCESKMVHNLENCQFPKKVNMPPVTSESTPRFLPKSNKNICPQKGLYEKIRNSFIPNSQDLGIFVNRWADYNQIVYIHTEEYCSAIKETNYWCSQQDESTSKWFWAEETQHKRVHILDSIYLKFQIGTSYGDRNQNSSCFWAESGGLMVKGMREFSRMMNIFYHDYVGVFTFQNSLYLHTWGVKKFKDRQHETVAKTLIRRYSMGLLKSLEVSYKTK